MRVFPSDKHEGLNLVVGTGLTGAVIAERIANVLGEHVLIIDKENHIGGMAYDYRDKNGILVSKFGPHIFHTDSKKVWEYVNSFADFNTFMYRVTAMADGVVVPFPFNLDSIRKLFPQSLAAGIERKLLEKFEYNSVVGAEELTLAGSEELNFLAEYIDKKFLVPAERSIFIGRDSRYYRARYQGVPCKGYSHLIENILKNHNIEICLNTDYKYMVARDFKRIFYTGSIDEFFNYKFGMLPYRSVKFKLEEFNTVFYQQSGTVYYPENYDFTKIHEYKHFRSEKSVKTVIAKEYREEYVYGENERCYPVLNEENLNLYKEYLRCAGECPELYFSGRLGEYRYYSMADAVLNALNLFENIFEKNFDLNSLYV